METKSINNYCRCCGAKIKNNAKNCSKCDATVYEKRVNISNKEKNLHTFIKTESTFICLIVICYVLFMLLPYINLLNIIPFLHLLYPIMYIVNIIILVTARITLPNSYSIKIITFIIIVFHIVYLFFVLAL